MRFGLSLEALSHITPFSRAIDFTVDILTALGIEAKIVHILLYFL